MLYLHKLSDFGPKLAHVESVYIIRELKQKTPFPLQEQRFLGYLDEFRVSERDKKLMEDALAQVEPILQALNFLLIAQDKVHEPVNIQRAIQTISELPPVLQSNIRYFEEMQQWQQGSLAQLIPLFNSIPTLRTKESKAACDEQLNLIFQVLLRNKEFAFAYMDVVHERQVALISDLHESIKKGYFFHVSLEEEIKKVSFDTIKARIPSEKLVEVEAIVSQLQMIRQGVERAYDVNKRMANLALILYSYIRWLASEQK